ncbi:uncharacterized protein LOC120161441 [Hibiscus syriacus]|uniref:uncharacterized protein LOC120161441 n=1 Tax=Hibiscus syriacus TaxID=106335 RepID=UPI00192041D5|nr:uncharacterized protein LOC120161441 [Hibiscus syriacus]
MLVREANNLITDLCSVPSVRSPTLLRVADATSKNAIGQSSAALFEETKDHSLKEIMGSSPSQNQNEVIKGRFIPGDIDSVLDQISAKSSDENVAVQSIRQGKHSSFHVEGSWPHKWRKINGQQINSLSFSLSLKEEDAEQLSAKFRVDEQNGGKYDRKERGGSENTSSTFMHNQFDVASVSSLPLESLENLDHSVDRTEAVDPSRIMFGSTKKCPADEKQIILKVGDKYDFANIQHLAYNQRSNKERKYQLGEDGEFSTYLISSPCRPPSDLIKADQRRPELEGFIIQTDGEQLCNGGEGINFEKLHLLSTTIGCTSLLEQLCKYACIHTPLPQFPSTCRLHQVTGLYQSVPNELLECTEEHSS